MGFHLSPASRAGAPGANRGNVWAEGSVGRTAAYSLDILGGLGTAVRIRGRTGHPPVPRYLDGDRLLSKEIKFGRHFSANGLFL